MLHIYFLTIAVNFFQYLKRISQTIYINQEFKIEKIY